MNLTRLIVLGAALLRVGCAPMTPPQAPPPTPPQISLPASYTDTAHRVSVTVDGLSRDDSRVTVNGIATNISDRDFSSLRLDFDVLDASGAKLDSFSADLYNGLKVSQKWRFQASFTDSYTVNFTSIKATTIT